MMNLVNNLPFVGRALSGLQTMQNANLDEQHKILQNLTGVKAYSFDIQQQQQIEANALFTKLQNVLTSAGVIAQYKRSYMPTGRTITTQ